MMVNDFFKAVAIRLGDEARVTYSNKELLSCLNDAITQLSLERIDVSAMEMIKEVTVTPGSTSIPSGFVRFVGQESVYPTNGKFFSLDNSVTPRAVRFFAVKPHVETKGDDLPFDDTTSLGVLLNYVVVLAAARVGDPANVEAQLAQKMSDAFLGRVGADASQKQEA